MGDMSGTTKDDLVDALPLDLAWLVACEQPMDSNVRTQLCEEYDRTFIERTEGSMNHRALNVGLLD